MKLSLDWLGDYLTWTESDHQAIARSITAHSAEVDDVEVQGALLDHCCVGKILSIAKHPDADRLSLCDVQTDQGKKRIVCGGSNLREGMRVAVAHVGARVRWHGDDMVTLEKAKIRGEASEGMICTGEELDLLIQYPDSKDRIVIDFGDGDEGVGESLREYLGLTDTVLHIDNHAITHRPDLFSHLGFARECVAIGLATWKPFDSSAPSGLAQGKKEPIFEPPEFTKDKIPFGFTVKDSALMPRYCACMIGIEGLGETPDWMLRRLEATGWRSVSLPVDITNYAMMEVGVPLHSFDAGDIRGTVQLRQAKKGEKITTLDESERELSEGALILSDDEGIFDLLGIMGGLRSSTKESTRAIYLHSASLDPLSIRNAMIQMGHRTDAGTVYEKGVPPIITEQGFYRTVQLMLELIPGAKIISHMDSYGENGAPESIALDHAHVNRYLGVDVPAERIQSILTDLGFTVNEDGEAFSVTPPLWRLSDIEDAHDLVEEIGRVYGFDAIEPVMPEASTVPPQRDQRLHQLRDRLRELGYFELVPLCMLSAEVIAKAGFDPDQSVRIANPLGEDVSLLQPSVLPQMFDHAASELRNVEADDLRTFHISNVFLSDGDEHMELGMLVANKQQAALTEESFLHLKTHVAEALQAAGFAADVRPAESPLPYAHPGRSADLFVGDQCVGQLFELHPKIRTNFDLPERASAVCINLSALLALPSSTAVYASLPQFPAVYYDETVTLDQTQAVAAILAKLRAASELLEHVDVADLYAGESLGAGQYNLTLRFTYRSPDRTLTEEEVKGIHEKVMKEIAN